MKHSIYVQSQFTAQHRWQECPHAAVAFLREWHRHVFKVRIDLWVEHQNRDLEFFLVKQDLDLVLSEFQGQRLDKSCEMFADSIYQAMQRKYQSLFRVEVSEDGENGAVLHV